MWRNYSLFVQDMKALHFLPEHREDGPLYQYGMQVAGAKK